jgi:EAL domain-containing protein (putative c-di-GMP-specific phosphodiesterase class I)
VGAEALVRWLHPERGLISPALFIPLAEETGMIIPVGLWVMKTACLQLKQWENDPKREHLTIAVNVSSQEFNEAAYVRQVEDILIETGIRPHKLKLELTESALASDVEAVVEKMRLLKDFGLRFSLDDFGTGFSSLSYLRRMPLNQLKIDQSFIRDVTQNTSDASIVKTVIALGKGLGLSVIAEGVETAEQEQLLSEFGCDLYQGYFFGRPQPIEEFERAAEQRQVALD